MRLLAAYRIVLAFGCFQASGALADAIVDRELGFEFTPPQEFHPRDPTDQDVVYEFTNRDVDDHSATRIFIRRLRQTVNPKRTTLADLRQRPGFRLTLQEHRWKTIELQVLRQDVALETGSLVGFVVQFPLKDEGIQLRVQGPAQRAGLVASVFSECVKSFNNLKPYRVKAEVIETAPFGSAGKWVPHQDLLSKLSETKQVGHYTIRPPTGYAFRDITTKEVAALGRRAFVIKKQRTVSQEAGMSLICFSKTEDISAGNALVALVKQIEAEGTDYSSGTLAKGDVNGVPAVRMNFSFANDSGRYAGFVVALEDESGVIACWASYPIGNIQEATHALRVLIASALTLQKSP